MENKRHVLDPLACLLLVGAALLGGAACAQQLKVVTEDWRPYNYLEGGEIKGVSTEIVKQVLAHAGVTYYIGVYPWARAYNMAQREPDTLIYTLIRIPQREKLFKWVRPLGKGGTTSLYRLKSRVDITPQSMEEAKKYRVVANLDSMDQQWLQDNGFSHLETPSKVEAAVRMFFAGNRVDMIAFDDSVLDAEFKTFGFNKEDVVNVMALFKTPPYFAVSLATSDAMVVRLQKAYDELLAKKEIKLVN